MQFFAKLKHVRAVMSEAKDGPMGSSMVAGLGGEYGKNRVQFLERSGIPPANTVMAGLMHGVSIRTLDALAKGGRVPDTDGLISWKQPIALTTQDCFPLFFAPLDPSDGLELVGIAHAGWLGIVKSIGREIVETFESKGVSRSNLAVAIGPGIRSCCFLVRDDERGVNQYLDRGYGDFVAEVKTDAQGNQLWSVDLLGILLFQLTNVSQGLGLSTKNIDADGALCTNCTLTDDGRPRFFSWRRDHVKANNMLSAIWLRPPGRGTETIRL